MRRTLLGSIVGLLLMASSTFAADGEVVAVPATMVGPAIGAPVAAFSRLETSASVQALTAGRDISRPFSVRRPSLLPGLYVGSASLQAFDAYSTLKALKNGAREQNALMKSAVSNPAVFVAVKAGVTVASIVAAERLWKDNNRMGAVLLMAASNGMMAVVAAHNASVLSRLR